MTNNIPKILAHKNCSKDDIHKEK